MKAGLPRVCASSARILAWIVLSLVHIFSFPNHEVTRAIVAKPNAALKLFLNLTALGPAQVGGALDHFQCYEAVGKPVKKIVSLKDQFLSAEEAKVGKPAFFCNPVDKNGEGILNPEQHLTCYDINIRSPDPKIIVENQFGKATLRVKGSKLLCVPSKKALVIVK